MKIWFQKHGFWPFLASIALNLFLISFFVSGPPHGHHRGTDEYIPLRGAIKTLSPEGQDIFKKAFLNNDELILETKDLLLEKRLEMVNEMAQEDLNLEDVNIIMSEINDLTHAKQQGLQVLLSQALEDLSHDDRVHLSKHLMRHKDKFRK